jgi:cobalt/nickel transport system permease protein
VGIFNPVFDRAQLLEIGGVGISGGWVSFASILLRFSLTVSAALALIGVTGFATVCMALGRMGLPRAFSIQLLFLYRYLFVLTEEGLRMSRARSLRSFKGRGLGFAVYGSMLGQLLLRTMDRAQRIHRAMLCRGFDGELRLSRNLAFTARDLAFVAGWLAYFALVRSVNLPQLLGRFVEGILT